MSVRPELMPVEQESGDLDLTLVTAAPERGSTLLYAGLQLLVVVVFLVIWQLASSTGVMDKFFISSPIDVGGRIWQWVADGSIFQHVVVTLREAILGWVTGSLAGVVIGFLLGRIAFLRRVFAPLLYLVNTLPRIALAPLFILWFGIGEFSKVVLVFTVIIFIMIFNTFGGVLTVNEDYLLTARLLGANQWQLTSKVIFPWCVPWVFIGLRLGLAWSLSGAVVGEFLAARAGVGYLIYYRASVLDNTGVLAGCVILLAMALVFFVAISAVEKRLLHWRPQGM